MSAEYFVAVKTDAIDMEKHNKFAKEHQHHAQNFGAVGGHIQYIVTKTNAGYLTEIKCRYCNVVQDITSDIPQDFPESIETFADVLKALGVDRLEEETDPRFEAFAVDSTRRIIQEEGRESFWRSRHLLKAQLEYLATM